MTLDCLFRNPMQSRVISGGSCYLTSYGYLTFYWFASTTRSAYRISISDIQLSLPRAYFAVHPRLWGSVLLCDLMLPVTSCGICVTRYTHYPTSWSLYWGSELTVGLRRSYFDFPGISCTAGILLCLRILISLQLTKLSRVFPGPPGTNKVFRMSQCWFGILGYKTCLGWLGSFVFLGIDLCSDTGLTAYVFDLPGIWYISTFCCRIRCNLVSRFATTLVSPFLAII